MALGSSTEESAAARASAGALQAAANPESGPLALWLLAIRSLSRQPLRRALAANPGAPKLLLRWLAHRRWDARAAVAANPRCPERLRKKLAWSPDWAVRAAVASSPATGSGTLEGLIGGADARIRLQVAGNPALTGALADRLLRDRDPYVRAVAAAHPSAPPAGLQRLASGMSEPAWVLRAIAGNPACPADLSDQLLTWIALGGAGHSDPLFDPVTCTGHPGDTRYTVMSWYLEQARGHTAAQHPLWRVRVLVLPARHSIAADVARELARDPRSEVRRTIAGVAVLPADLRLELTCDADPGVARLAAAAAARKGAAGRGRWDRTARLLVSAALPLLVVVAAIVAAATTPGQPAAGRPPVSAAAGSEITAGSGISAGSWPLGAGSGIPTTMILSGGGAVMCGLTTSSPHTGVVLVNAGRTEVKVDIPGAVRVPGGQAVPQPVVVAAGQQAQYFFRVGRSPVKVALDGSGPLAGQMIPMPGCSR